MGRTFWSILKRSQLLGSADHKVQIPKPCLPQSHVSRPFFNFARGTVARANSCRCRPPSGKPTFVHCASHPPPPILSPLLLRSPDETIKGPWTTLVRSSQFQGNRKAISSASLRSGRFPVANTEVAFRNREAAPASTMRGRKFRFQAHHGSENN